MKIILLLLLLFHPVQQDESGIISGLVMNMSGIPLSGVKVVVSEGEGDLCGTGLSDESGRFSISRIPFGLKKIYFIHDKYRLKEAEVTLSDNSREIYRSYQLEAGQGPNIWQVQLGDQIMFQDAVLNLDSQQFEKALGQFKSFARKYPYHVKNAFNIGLCYSHKASEKRKIREEEEAEQYEKEARKQFQMLLNLHPDHFAATQALAESYVRSGMMDRAEELYASLVATKEDDYYLWYVYGEILSVNDKKSSAVAAYERVLRINPGFHRAHARIGNIHMERKDYAKAIRRYEAFLRLAPGTFMTRVTQEKLRECKRRLEAKNR